MSLMMTAAATARPSQTYATWNPSDKAAGITLSGGNLTAAIPATTTALVRATIGKSSGKWYWEVTGAAGVGPLAGIAKLAVATTQWPGQSVDSWGYYSQGGGVYNNGSPVVTGAGYVAGDVIGYALDMTVPELKIYKNNALQATVSIAAATWYPTAGQSGGGNSCNAVANFGATALVYSPPAGFNAGLYL